MAEVQVQGFTAGTATVGGPLYTYPIQYDNCKGKVDCLIQYDYFHGSLRYVFCTFDLFIRYKLPKNIFLLPGALTGVKVALIYIDLTISVWVREPCPGIDDCPTVW